MQQIKIHAIISAAFNFFINGMIAALIHHKADTVSADTADIAIDLIITCISIFILTALFSGANVRQANTAGTLETASRTIRFLSGLFRRPILFGVLLGIVAAVFFFGITAPVFALLKIRTLPFGVYVALKCAFTALLGGAAAALDMYVGMCNSNMSRKRL
jgi:hypothetical protein